MKGESSPNRGWKYGLQKVWNHDLGKLGGYQKPCCSSNSVIILLIASLHPFEGSQCERNAIAIFGTPKTSPGKEQGCISSITPRKMEKPSGYVFCPRRFDQFSYPPIQFTNFCLDFFHGKSRPRPPCKGFPAQDGTWETRKYTQIKQT